MHFTHLLYLCKWFSQLVLIIETKAKKEVPVADLMTNLQLLDTSASAGGDQQAVARKESASSAESDSSSSDSDTSTSSSEEEKAPVKKKVLFIFVGPCDTRILRIITMCS